MTRFYPIHNVYSDKKSHAGNEEIYFVLYFNKRSYTFHYDLLLRS